MWCSCLILQQITGRRLWVAEGPPGGLAGGLYPAALRLHLCSGSQSGLLPELCPRHGHANLLTRLHVSSDCTSAGCHSDCRACLTMGTTSAPALLFLLTCCWAAVLRSKSPLLYPPLFGLWHQCREQRQRHSEEPPFLLSPLLSWMGNFSLHM